MLNSTNGDVSKVMGWDEEVSVWGQRNGDSQCCSARLGLIRLPIRQFGRASEEQRARRNAGEMSRVRSAKCAAISSTLDWSLVLARADALACTSGLGLFVWNWWWSLARASSWVRMELELEWERK